MINLLVFALLVTAQVLVGATLGEARTLCTIVADAADGTVVIEHGDCRTRVTPASTFKIPLAVMGFDSGILQDAHTPPLPFRQGYPDWGGAAWKKPTDPTRWLKYSVVWYSQQVTHRLGAARVQDYTRRFGFGNADLSGDPGKNNGLDRAWIMSSLAVSPREQITFLRRLIGRELPVSAHATDETLAVVERTAAPGGWSAQGKTGTAYPRDAVGASDEAHGLGWYVGWIGRAGRTFVFARLDQDDAAQPETTGIRTRQAFLSEWPALIAALPH